MVDEFQDASQARARLTRGLVQDAGKHNRAVGDDCQFINRFAGADISVMTEFARWFGVGPTLWLQTTFRCPHSICDIAGSFDSKNPRQLPKVVTSADAAPGAGGQVLRLPDAGAAPNAIGEHLNALARTCRSRPGARQLPTSI